MIRLPLLPSPSPRASRCPVKNGWSRSGTLPLGRFRLSVVLLWVAWIQFSIPPVAWAEGGLLHRCLRIKRCAFIESWFADVSFMIQSYVMFTYKPATACSEDSAWWSDASLSVEIQSLCKGNC